MKFEVIFLSGSLQLSGSTTWMNTLISGFEQQNIPCAHVVTGQPGRIKSNATYAYYTGRPRKQWLLRVMRLLQLHKICAQLYKKKEAVFYTKRIDLFLKNRLADKVLIIKDFSAYLPSYFINSQFIVTAVLHQQYSEYEVGYYHNRLCSVSENVRDKSNKIGFNVQQVIYNPLNIETIQKKAKEYEVSQSGYILFVGNLYKEKGIFELLDAYSQLLSDRLIKENLVYVGEGKDMQRLQDKVNEYQLQGRVLLTGFLINPYPYIKKAKLLVLPSYSEAMGYVAIEAAALKTAYLVSNFSAAQDFFHENNIFEMSEGKPDISAMKEKILSLINKPSYALRENLLHEMEVSNVVSEFYKLLHTVKN